MDINKKKKKLEEKNKEIRQNKMQGIYVRSPVQWINEGEKNNYLLLQFRISKLYK